MKKENKDILIVLLEKVLEVKIKDVEYLNVEDIVDNVSVRKKTYDLRLDTNIGRIQVEINSSIYDYSHERQVAYLCNEYSHITLSGEDYETDINIIQINFTYGMMKKFKEKNKELYDDMAIRIYKIQDDLRKEYVKNYKIYDVNMDYYMNFWYTNDKEKIEANKYFIMLDLDLENLEKLSKKDRKVEKYMEEINKVNKNPKFIEYMSYEEDQRKRFNTMKKRAIRDGYEDGREAGLKQGLKQGIKEGKLEGVQEIAKKMMKDGIDKDIIMKYTNLTEEEINLL